jgi:alpha-glucosidase
MKPLGETNASETLEKQALDSNAPWWVTAVTYQIYPRSFCDTTGNGVGDLEGIRQHVDYLTWLGIDAVWISPFYPSPMKDTGYDISDYCDVDPMFGDMQVLRLLVDELHANNIKVLFDLVPNHTSDQHPWFIESRSSRDNPKRDWYIWRDQHEDGSPPNNWLSSFVEATDPSQAKPVTVNDFLHQDARPGKNPSAWTHDEHTDQSYLHLFLPEQPDLNWRNPELVNAMHEVVEFWLDWGIDGFRVDVVHAIGKDADLADDDESAHGHPKSAINNDPYTHSLLQGLRRTTDAYEGDRVLVGEVFLLEPKKVAEYYGDNDELHLAFNFLPLFTQWNAASWLDRLREVQDFMESRGAWPAWGLSNHDVPRMVSRYGSEARARAAATMLLTLRGAPFIFAGDELGMQDAEPWPWERVDLGGRDASRAPFPWTDTVGHGWKSEETWLPWAPGSGVKNVKCEMDDPTSMLAHYRALLDYRKQHPVMQLGTLTLLEAPMDVIAYERAYQGERRVVLINFDDTPRTIELEGSWVVDVASDETAIETHFDGHLHPDAALVLRPAVEG